MRILLVTIIAFLLSACSTSKQAYISKDAKDRKIQQIQTDNQLVHTLYLAGDAGELDDVSAGTNYTMLGMKKMLDKENENSSLVFLGDNIYPAGLPPLDDPTRGISEKKLNVQLDAGADYMGDIYFIPGNHDWNEYHKGGRKAVKRQEDYVTSYFGSARDKAHFYPKNACGDPKVVKINKDLVFVFIDTQWWLQDWDQEKKMNRKCDIKSRGDLLKTLEEVFIDHKNDEIVVLMHHPIKSDGEHGGRFGAEAHLLPLNEVGIPIPLPVIGSLYPILRRGGFHPQDINNEKNQEIMQRINKLAKKLKLNVLFAAGHEHNLQYFDADKLKYIVSGAGSKTTFLKKNGKADYARQQRGFAKVSFYENFEVWVEFYTVESPGTDAQLDFRTQIRAPRAGTVEDIVKYPPLTAHDTMLPANADFAAGGLKKMFLGKQYRDMWSTPVTAEIIDLQSKYGGLTPIKKGGGMASNSLRMEADNEKQYILRSINKDYTKLVPAGFENLKLINVMKDQNSASHPYGALIIPALSQAAGIYYTWPKLMYLKHQEGLGNYNSQFPEELYLLEERPSGNWSDAEQFGNSSEIISYADLLEKLRTKKSQFVDQEWALKSRMFDMWIHDWDRHDDQWRWASWEDGDRTIYRPIPRDRDQAFYKFVGAVPWYISTFMMKKFKTMKDDVRDVPNLAFNARTFDRYFLNELEWKDWQTIIKKMQDDISDEEIINAFDLLPPQAHMNDEELIYKLKSRRDKLESICRKWYNFISKEVQVTGTDEKDKFDIQILKNGVVHLRSFVERKSKVDLLKYERTFYPNETKEIRLFGLRGKDHFSVTGNNKTPIKIRIIGGEDKDKLTNESPQKIIIYDNEKGLKAEGKVKDRRSQDLNVNDYDREWFTYNTTFPILTLGSSPDDGFWIGGAFTWTTQGWRKDPYKSKHSISGRISTGNQGAYGLTYNGHFPNVFGKADFLLSASAPFPYNENFFGLGNNSTNTAETNQYNWVRVNAYHIEPLVRVNRGSYVTIDVGPTFHSYRVNETAGRISEDIHLFSGTDFDRRNYLGGTVRIGINLVDQNLNPGNGLRLNTSYSYQNALNFSEDISTFDANLTVYMSLLPDANFVIANKTGYENTSGDLQFYQYADLGNNSNLRGYRNERFRGNRAFYNNTDVRLHLFDWQNSFLPMDVGIVGGFDIGRVWLDNEDSDDWHNSKTVGLSMNILGVAILQPYYSWTDDGNQFTFKMGYNF